MSWKLMLASTIGVAVKSVPIPIGTPRPLIAASMGDLDMEPSPIEPSWVIAGDPQARIALHSRAHDDAATTAVWDCSAGTFRWYFGWDETVIILEGEVHVTAEDGSERILRAGDIGYFAGKTWATWHIDNYVRKIAFCRKSFPAPVTFAYRLRDLLRGPQRGGLAA
ncbi:MAG: cupin domain-containing protein [Shinella sp.]|nr:cupin domain-containing protein [Shinella sp.]